MMTWRRVAKTCFGPAAVGGLGVLFLAQVGLTHGVDSQKHRSGERAAVHHEGRADHQSAPTSNGYSRTVAQYNVPNVVLMDARGRSSGFVSELAADHRPVILQFIFTTCPGVCPILSSVMQRAQQIMGPDAAQVRMWSVSTDPEYDTPNRLLSYAESFGAGVQWRFLTGKLRDIEALQKSFHAFWGNKMDHQPLIFIWPGRGHQWTRLDGYVQALDLIAEYQAAIGN